MEKTFSTTWAGKPLKIQVGKLAQQANASAVVTHGGTVVLASVVMSPEARQGMDFFPLTVEYEERLYASGKIKGSRFIKREGRPTDDAVLLGRLVDRSIRPLFDESMRNEIQVVATTLSYDHENSPDVPALLAVATALQMSHIPWNGPLAGIRMGRIDGKMIVNPTAEEHTKSEFDLFVAGTTEKVLMIESGASETTEEVMYEAIMQAKREMAPALDLMKQVVDEFGKEKLVVAAAEVDEAIKKLIKKAADEVIIPGIDELFFGKPKDSKVARREAKSALKAQVKEWLKKNEVEETSYGAVLSTIEGLLEERLTVRILEEGVRVDGRALDEVRRLSAEVGLFERNHGTGLFERGETQVLTTTTLGSPGDEQTLDGMEINGTKRFMHHYNFPPYSVGEVKPMRGPGRREIGHGALAEKALERMIPAKETFPYTIRLVSEVLSSNGSSSMGSTCGSTLALMDAGVPIKAPVAGIAMGLASEADAKGNMKRWKVITDIQDLEDGDGGMDFKVAGTKNGITAIQLDTKTLGLNDEIVKETLTRAKAARLKVLDVMLKAISAPRPELSKYAPRITTLKINPDKIRDVIGPGGKMINEIIAKTGVQIDIEDDGSIFVTATNAESSKEAIAWIGRLTKEVKAGEIFTGKVTRLMDFGAFVEVAPRQEGLVHVSEMAPFRVGKASDVMNVGDIVTVKVIEIDELGRINLSYKQAPGNKFENMDPSQYPKSDFAPRGPKPTGRPPFKRNDR